MIDINVLKRGLTFKVSQPCTMPSMGEIIRYNFSIDYDVHLPSYGINLQRGLVWSIEQKQNFIRSVITNENILPLSIIIDDVNCSIIVIDGKQRLSTLLSFINNEFPLNYNNREVYYSDIDDKYAYFLNYSFNAYMYYNRPSRPDLSDEQKIEWFLHVNNTGTPQQDEHIHSLINLK